jgi:hypothetical protein
LLRRRFVTGDVLLRRRFVTGDVLLRRRFVEETFCYGDVLSRRRFVRRRFVCASRIQTRDCCMEDRCATVESSRLLVEALLPPVYIDRLTFKTINFLRIKSVDFLHLKQS